MLEPLFAFWKDPDKKEVLKVTGAGLKMKHSPDLNDEGFFMAPFSIENDAYFIKGKITFVHQLEEMDELAINFLETSTDETEQDYPKLVQNGVESIKKGLFQKVVLARKKTEKINSEFRISQFFKTLVDKYPKAMIYCFGFQNEIWMGASPEIFLLKQTNHYLTYALAGTKSPNSKQVFGHKEIQEQLFVKDYIIESLKALGAQDMNDSAVSEHNTGNLIHLISKISFKHDNPNEILNALHPTPAVCGYPTVAAKNFIQQYEAINREFYSGYFGPCYGHGAFSFWVNLRCAKIMKQSISYFAGAGIVEDSNPNAEFIETELKMETLRSNI